MTPENAFLTAIRELEEQLHGKKLRMEKELVAVEANRDALLAERDSISRAKERRLNFRLMLGGDYQCPSCWITNEDRSAMRPVTSRADDDYFECRFCGYGIQIPSGR